MINYKIEELRKSDYNHGFLQLLEQLTTVGAKDISYDEFSNHLNKMNSQIFIIKNEDNKVIGTSSVLIEEKFIHKLSPVAHIEDVVVDLEYRKKGLGKLLIDYCIEYAKNKGCYKILLNCDEKNMKFYAKSGFNSKNVEMSLYL